MRILFLGEIVGKAGHFTLKTNLRNFVTAKQIHFVIANGNGTTGGFGLGRNHALMMRKYGVNLLTGGECIYHKKDMVEFIEKAPWILRPANLPPGSPGRSWGIYNTPVGSVGVISMLGLSGYNRMHGSNPFSYLPHIVEKLRERTPVIILNFHATASAEKTTMAFYADGMLSAMVGTGTRCLTADAKIYPKGMASITDAGRIGSHASIYGMESTTEMRILLNRVPERSKNGWGDLRMQGVIMEFTEDGKSQSIDIVNIPSYEEPDDLDRKDS